jgi:hypothetical protein
VNSEPHTGARLSVRLCVGLIKTVAAIHATRLGGQETHAGQEGPAAPGGSAARVLLKYYAWGHVDKQQTKCLEPALRRKYSNFKIGKNCFYKLL